MIESFVGQVSLLLLPGDFSDTCPIQFPQQRALGLTGLLRSWSLRDCDASITVQLTGWTAAAVEATYQATDEDGVKHMSALSFYGDSVMK